MPLSEHEQRALAELEAQLSAEDPRFASLMVADPRRAARRKRLLISVFGVVIGIGLVGLAVVLKQPWIGAPGFVILVLSLAHAASKPPTQLYLVNPAEGMPVTQPPKPKKTGFTLPTNNKPRSSSNGDFMARMEERWERRRRQNQGW